MDACRGRIMSRVVVCLIALFAVHVTFAIDYTHDKIQYQSIATKTGAYNFGYDTGVFGAHSFHQEWRDEDGEVRGRYGYTDPNGDLRITNYKAGRDGYRTLSNTVQPGNPVRAGPRPPPGSGEALVVPGAGVVSRGVSADVAAEPISNYRNALVAYPNGPREDYALGKSRYIIPYRRSGQVGRLNDARQSYSRASSKLNRYYDRSAEPMERVYYKDGRRLSYNPFEAYAQRTALGYNPFA